MGPSCTPPVMSESSVSCLVPPPDVDRTNRNRTVWTTGPAGPDGTPGPPGTPFVSCTSTLSHEPSWQGVFPWGGVPSIFLGQTPVSQTGERYHVYPFDSGLFPSPSGGSGRRGPPLGSWGRIPTPTVFVRVDSPRTTPNPRPLSQTPAHTRGRRKERKRNNPNVTPQSSSPSRFESLSRDVGGTPRETTGIPRNKTPRHSEQVLRTGSQPPHSFPSRIPSHGSPGTWERGVDQAGQEPPGPYPFSLIVWPVVPRGSPPLGPPAPTRFGPRKGTCSRPGEEEGEGCVRGDSTSGSTSRKLCRDVSGVVLI